MGLSECKSLVLPHMILIDRGLSRKLIERRMTVTWVEVITVPFRLPLIAIYWVVNTLFIREQGKHNWKDALLHGIDQF